MFLLWVTFIWRIPQCSQSDFLTYSSGQERFWNQTRLYSFFVFMYVYILWQGQKAVLTILEFEVVDIFYFKFQLVSTFSICSKFCAENWLLCSDLSCKWVTCRSGCKRFWKQTLHIRHTNDRQSFSNQSEWSIEAVSLFSRGSHLVGTIALRIQWQNYEPNYAQVTAYYTVIFSLQQVSAAIFWDSWRHTDGFYWLLQNLPKCISVSASEFFFFWKEIQTLRSLMATAIK